VSQGTSSAQIELLCALILCQKPEIVVEAGTYTGLTAYRIAKTLREIGRGHLHTADPVEMGQDGVLGGVGCVTFYQQDFLEVLATLPFVDFAYIDASEHQQPAGARLRWQHFEAVRAKLRPEGIICVDDTAADDWRDGENGLSVRRIREQCLNFRFQKGLSVYTCT
jgi:predicted O-methyltransferase YrrM